MEGGAEGVGGAERTDSLLLKFREEVGSGKVLDKRETLKSFRKGRSNTAELIFIILGRN